MVDYLTHIQQSSLRLREAAHGQLRQPVPSCPGWTVADLLFHVGEVHWFWGEITRRGETDPVEEDYPDPPRPAADELVAWVAQQTDALLAALSDLKPDQPLWNWSVTPKVGAFVPRRMAQETAVHCWDGEHAVGEPADIDPGLAADGIDEYLEVFLGSAGPYTQSGIGVIRLAPTYHPQRWSIVLEGTTPTVERSDDLHADLTLQGPVSDLLLSLWLRDVNVARDGDPQLWEGWQRHVAEVNT